jgi:hypothetical protein
MADSTTLGPEQIALLSAIYGGLKQRDNWPSFQFVDKTLDALGIDAEEVAKTLPPGLSNLGPGQFFRDTEEATLTIAGLYHCPGTEADLKLIFQAVQIAVEIEQSYQPTLDARDRPALRSSQLLAQGADAAAVQRVYLVIRFEPWSAGSGLGQEGWEIFISRAIRRFRGVKTLEEYLERRADFFGQAARVPPEVRIPPAVRLGIRPGTVLGIEPEPVEAKEGKYIFVIMPLKTEFDEVYATIRSACGKFPNVTFERSDDFTQTGRITDQIIAALKTADLIIAVITEQNANVMYELGYAHALGQKVVVMNADQGSPFDVQDYRQVRYTNDDLLSTEEILTKFVQTGLGIEPNR